MILFNLLYASKIDFHSHHFLALRIRCFIAHALVVRRETGCSPFAHAVSLPLFASHFHSTAMFMLPLIRFVIIALPRTKPGLHPARCTPGTVWQLAREERTIEWVGPFNSVFALCVCVNVCWELICLCPFFRAFTSRLDSFFFCFVFQFPFVNRFNSTVALIRVLNISFFTLCRFI